MQDEAGGGVDEAVRSARQTQSDTIESQESDFSMTQPDSLTTTYSNSAFQQAIEAVEALSLEDQQALLELLQRRLADQQRQALSQEIAEVRQEYAEGKVRFGSVSDFLAELDD